MITNEIIQQWFILLLKFKIQLMLTRVFQNGDSPAVCIPNELHFANIGQDVEIELEGNAMVLRPVVRETLASIGEIFAMFSPSFMAEGRELHGDAVVTHNK